MEPPIAPAAGSERPILAVFLDGLGADAIRHMPFLSSQSTIRRLRTELGYSITCHASMYTGLRPDRHGLWFVWQRGPERSPFRWLRAFRFLDRVDNLPMHVAATKLTRRFVRTTSWFGVPYPIHIPWRYLPELDISERRLWIEPGYLDTAPTVFDRLRSAGVGFEVVGMAKGPTVGLAAVEGWSAPGAVQPLTYFFAGDVDHASHAHGQDSPEVASLLRRVDAAIERQLQVLSNRAGAADLVVWSDHGHHDVQRLDPFELFGRHRFDITRHLHVIDTNFVRLWVDDPQRRRDVVHRLNAMGVGHVLSDEELERYRVRMSDDRYGNVIFYLELPHAFSRTIWGFGRRLASAHGYLPEHPRSDGVFVSSMPAREGLLDLVDIAPTLLARMGLPIPAGLDGQSVWR